MWPCPRSSYKLCRPCVVHLCSAESTSVSSLPFTSNSNMYFIHCFQEDFSGYFGLWWSLLLTFSTHVIPKYWGIRENVIIRKCYNTIMMRSKTLEGRYTCHLIEKTQLLHLGVVWIALHFRFAWLLLTLQIRNQFRYWHKEKKEVKKGREKEGKKKE